MPLTMPSEAPSPLWRVAVFAFLWAACGLVLYWTYQTDGCPPDVKHREAIWSGLLTPLVLSGNASACIRQPSWQPVVGISFLIAYCAIAVVLLRSRSITRLATASIVLAMLSGLGLWCTFHSYAHSGG